MASSKLYYSWMRQLGSLKTEQRNIPLRTIILLLLSHGSIRSFCMYNVLHGMLKDHKRLEIYNV